MPSPLLDRPDAVPTPDGSADAGICWHYGDPLGEQRIAESASALVDLSHRDVIAVTGAERLSWLHTLTSQQLEDLGDGTCTEALVLSPTGHLEHHFGVTAVGDTVFLDTDAGRGAALQDYLESMRFWSKVELAPAGLAILRIVGPTRSLQGAPEQGAAARGDGFVRIIDAPLPAVDVAVPTSEIAATAQAIIDSGAKPIGSWAADALRIPTRIARFGVDSDERTIPNEVSLLGSAVHLDKGCYRGQETVARVHNLGRPPRRLVMLNLDGSADGLPATGAEVVTAAGRTVGRVGTVAHHHEWGPIALALIKRSLPIDTPLLAGGVDARIDPDDALSEADSAPRSSIERRALPTLNRR